MSRLWVCTCSPAAMGRLAKPMIWLYRRTGSPCAMARIAILWPGGIRPRTLTCSTRLPPRGWGRAVTTAAAGWGRVGGEELGAGDEDVVGGMQADAGSHHGSIHGQ